jgi:hypothetical protein
MAKKTIKTNDYQDSAKACRDIADDLATKYWTNGNVKEALATATLYRTASALSKTVLLCQKQTGKPTGPIEGMQ